MTDPLPDPIARFFDGRNARDFDAALAAFAPAAAVADEGGLHGTPEAIRAWMRDTVAKYDDRATVRTVARTGERIEVAAEVSGDFPGSPAVLSFRFTLDGARIARLEIGA